MEIQQIFSTMVENRLNEFKAPNNDEYVWLFDGENKMLSRYHDRKHSAFPNMIKPKEITYISGAMTGVTDLNKPLFEKYEKLLVRKNHYPINPHKIKFVEKPMNWIEYMKEDIKHLLNCDSMIVLQGWETSNGARIEIFIAQQLKLKIYDHEFNEFLPYGQLKFY